LLTIESVRIDLIGYVTCTNTSIDNNTIDQYMYVELYPVRLQHFTNECFITCVYKMLQSKGKQTHRCHVFPE